MPEALEVGVEPATHLARGRGKWDQPHTCNTRMVLRLRLKVWGRG